MSEFNLRVHRGLPGIEVDAGAGADWLKGVYDGPPLGSPAHKAIKRSLRGRPFRPFWRRLKDGQSVRAPLRQPRK